MARLVCGRWSSWIVVALWVAALLVLGPMAGKLSDVQQNDNQAWLPGNAEATQVIDLQARFQAEDVAPAVIVTPRWRSSVRWIQPVVFPRPAPTLVVLRWRRWTRRGGALRRGAVRPPGAP